VVDEGRVVGVITLQDVLTRIPVTDPNAQTTGPFHRWERAQNELSLRTATFVRDVCSHHALTVSPHAPLAAAAALMAAARVNRLPVVDEEGRLAGVLARDDVVRTVARAYEEALERRTRRVLTATVTP
jgi:CBS domain-containing protein